MVSRAEVTPSISAVSHLRKIHHHPKRNTWGKCLSRQVDQVDQLDLVDLGDHRIQVGLADLYYPCLLQNQVVHLFHFLLVDLVGQLVRYRLNLQALPGLVVVVSQVDHDLLACLVDLLDQVVLVVQVAQAGLVANLCLVDLEYQVRLDCLVLPMGQVDLVVRVGKVCMVVVLVCRTVSLVAYQDCQVYQVLLVFLAFQVYQAVHSGLVVLANSILRNSVVVEVLRMYRLGASFSFRWMINPQAFPSYALPRTKYSYWFPCSTEVRVA